MRRIHFQFIFVIFIITLLLRLISFDSRSLNLLILGLNFTRDQLFYPLFLLIVTVVFILYLSNKKGRIFCSYGCPVHFFLEVELAVEKKYRKIYRILTGCLLSFTLASSVVLFFLSFSQIKNIYKDKQFFLFLMIIFLIMLFLFFTILVVYREKFCKHACPYALLQMVVQTGETEKMVFDNSTGNCINCIRCDKTCPFSLDVRKECETLFCSNCNRCHDACVQAIGGERVVLNMTGKLNKGETNGNV